MEFENPLVVTLDNKVVYETVIGGEEDMKLYDQVQNGALDRVNARLKNIRFTATAGPHHIGVTFQRRTFAESDDQLQMFAPGGGQDRLYRVNSFQVSGPFNADGLERRRRAATRIFSCHPPSRRVRGGAGARARGRSSPTLATRAYRRPVAERGRATSSSRTTRTGAKAGGFEERHPQRHHRHSREPVLPLSRRARAGRHAPGRHLRHQRRRAGVEAVVLPLEHDSRRRAAAAGASSGKLGDAAVLDAQVRRMLADPRASTLASNFVHQWLDMKRLDEIVPGLDGVPVRLGPRRSARRLPHRADAVRRQHLPRGPQRRRSADARSTRSSTSASRCSTASPDVKGDRFQRVELAAVGALGAARQGRRADGRGVSEPHVAGAARRVHPQAHSGRAAGDAAAGRADARRKGHRHDQGADRPRDDGEAPREPDLLRRATG